LEGRLRMNSVTRQDGVKEKRAELTLARLHPCGAQASAPSSRPALSSPPQTPPAPAGAPGRKAPPSPAASAPARRETPAASPPPVWNTSPLVPDDLSDGEDEIPF
jgi:hypothetical protein